MKNWKWILLAVLVVAIILFFVFKTPKITIVSIDKTAKKAVIKIGGKTINYTYDKKLGFNSKVGINDISITPNSGTQNSSVINVSRNGKPVTSEIINFD